VGNINVLSTAFGDVRIKGGEETELRLSDDDVVEGNSLSVSAKSKDGSVIGESHSGVKLDFTWFPDHLHHDVLTYAFYKQKAIVQNKRGSIWFYNCKIDHGHHARECHEYANFPGNPSQPLGKIDSSHGVLFTWTCTDTDCHALFVQDHGGDVSKIDLGLGVRDMVITEDHLVPNWIRVIATFEDKVEIFRGPRYELSFERRHSSCVERLHWL